MSKINKKKEKLSDDDSDSEKIKKNKIKYLLCVSELMDGDFQIIGGDSSKEIIKEYKKINGNNDWKDNEYAIEYLHKMPVFGDIESGKQIWICIRKYNTIGEKKIFYDYKKQIKKEELENDITCIIFADSENEAKAYLKTHPAYISYLKELLKKPLNKKKNFEEEYDNVDVCECIFGDYGSTSGIGWFVCVPEEHHANNIIRGYFINRNIAKKTTKKTIDKKKKINKDDSVEEASEDDEPKPKKIIKKKEITTSESDNEDNNKKQSTAESDDIKDIFYDYDLNDPYEFLPMKITFHCDTKKVSNKLMKILKYLTNIDEDDIDKMKPNIKKYVIMWKYESSLDRDKENELKIIFESPEMLIISTKNIKRLIKDKFPTVGVEFETIIKVSFNMT